MNSLVFFIVCIIVFLLFFFINKLLKATNWYRNQFIDSRKFLSCIPSGLEVVNLGSTQPKFAFDYKDSGMVGMNWALSPQPFDYDFKILKQYHTHLKENAFVLIPVCTFSFFVDTYKNDTSNYKYYPFLNKTLINKYTALKRNCVLRYPILTAKKQIGRILKDVAADKRMILQENPLNATLLQQDALQWIEGWKKEFNIEDLSQVSLSLENSISIENNIKIVKQLLLFCKKHHYRPIFILLPATKELSSYFSDYYIQKHMLDYIGKANITHAPILNYFKDKRFCTVDYYINSFFFNVKGRRVFTEMVIDDLKLLKQ